MNERKLFAGKAGSSNADSTDPVRINQVFGLAPSSRTVIRLFAVGIKCRGGEKIVG